jgi:hypothetical protein
MCESTLRRALDYALPRQPGGLPAEMNAVKWVYLAKSGMMTGRFRDGVISCGLLPAAPPFSGRPLWFQVESPGWPRPVTWTCIVPQTVFPVGAATGGTGDVG